MTEMWCRGSKGSSSPTKRKLDKAKPVNKLLVDEPEEEQSNENGSGVHSSSIEVDQSSVDVSIGDGSDREESHQSSEESDRIDGANTVANNKKKECYFPAIPFKTGPDFASDDEEEEDEAELIDSCESDSDDSGWMKSPRSNKKELFSGSVEEKVGEQDTESESIQSDNSDYLLPKKMQKEKVRSINRKHSVKKDVKYQESKKRRLKDACGSVEAILDSIIRQKDDVQEKEGDCIPLQFRFDDSDDESLNQITDESDVEALFQQMNFELQSEEIGSYGNPKVENQDKDGYDDHDNEATHVNCERGNHGDIYLEEQTGLRCRLCGAVLLESRYVIPKLANYAPDRIRGYHSNEQQFSPSENPYFQDSDGKHLDIRMQTNGTVNEHIPEHIRGNLFRHQQEGFKFLWENLAGTIEIQGLQTLGPRGSGGGGGCIISHAPGTGKTLLTIVFIETFLKMFPGCCPVIVSPASMLLTWEAEFKKWKVGFSFINLNNSESLNKLNIGCSKNNKDWIRAMKIQSWSKGGSVLGLSYNLYEQIAGSSNTENVKLVKMGNLLLDLPGLVVLDEGHTPRNHRSNIWNTLLKLKTKNRVILSGTPFQNNFRELFNTLRLVRPEIAKSIVNKKVFAGMIQGRNSNISTSMSTSEAIEKLKVIIAPFVNVYKGHILESKLPGLKQSIILLNPPPLQKGLIEICRNASTTNFKYEHNVALVSVHPSLILHCSLSVKEEKSTDRQKLENVRLHADVGVKTRIVMELIRLSVSLSEKVLIFSQYIQPLELLKDQIAHVFSWDFGREFVLIKGGIPQKLRQTIISDFNDPSSESKVLLASTKCCSEGIHLVGASRVVLLDVVWNPAVEKQAISRAYRLGQKKVVHTYHLMVAGTTEEEKYDVQMEKGRLAEMVFSSSGEEPKNKNAFELNDIILEEMVDHPKLKDMFKKIKYPEN